MKIGFDVDGVFADFNLAFYRLLVSVFGQRDHPFDYNRCDTWLWFDRFGYSQAEARQAFAIIRDNPEWWGKVPPIPDEPHLLHTMDQINALHRRHEVYFLTHREPHAAQHVTQRWLRKHGMYNPTVILTGSDKVPTVQALGLTHYVDDRPENVIGVRGSCPNVRVVMKRAPHNRSVSDAELAGYRIGVTANVRGFVQDLVEQHNEQEATAHGVR